MGVQIVENWSAVTATVRGVRPSTELPGFVVVDLAIERLEDVPGFPNLLATSPPQQLEVNVPIEQSHRLGLATGVRVSGQVRMEARRRVFVHPDHFAVG